MPSVTCSCGTLIEIPDGPSGEPAVCPVCQMVVTRTGGESLLPLLPEPGPEAALSFDLTPEGDHVERESPPTRATWVKTAGGEVFGLAEEGEQPAASEDEGGIAPAASTPPERARPHVRGRADRELPGEPVTWARLLWAPFDPLRVLIPALGLTAFVLLFLGLPRLVGHFVPLAELPALGVAALVVLYWLPYFFVWIVTVAAYQERWPGWRMSGLRWVAYQVYVLALSLAPLGLLLYSQEIGSALFTAALVPAAVWAVLYYAMSLTATGAYRDPAWNAVEVVTWIWRCLPDVVLLLPAILASVALAAAAAAGLARAADPDARVESTVQAMREYVAFLQRWPPPAAGRQPDWGRMGLPAALGVLVVLYAAAATFHVLGLVVRRRREGLGWEDRS